jgi:hypothetical protein
MNFNVELTKYPRYLNDCTQEDIAKALGKILNADLGLFWNTEAVVTVPSA